MIAYLCGDFSGKLPLCLDWFGYRLVWLYRASHQFDNVHAMQGVRPFCGLISYFFPQKNNLSFPAEPEKKLTSSLDPKVVSAEHQFASWLEKIFFGLFSRKRL